MLANRSRTAVTSQAIGSARDVGEAALWHLAALLGILFLAPPSLF
jgi:hypothetical protein